LGIILKLDLGSTPPPPPSKCVQACQIVLGKVHKHLYIHKCKFNVLYFEIGLSFDGLWNNVILKLLYEDVVGFVVKKNSS
jgi:hypothetical protein